jgi:hypothetical protein
MKIQEQISKNKREIKRLRTLQSGLTLLRSLILVGLIAYTYYRGVNEGVISQETSYELFLISLMFLLYYK